MPYLALGLLWSGPFPAPRPHSLLSCVSPRTVRTGGTPRDASSQALLACGSLHPKGRASLSPWATPAQLLGLSTKGFAAHRAPGSFPGGQRPCVSLDGGALPSDCHVGLLFASLPCSQGVASPSATFCSPHLAQPARPQPAGCSRGPGALAQAPAFFLLSWPRSQSDGSHPLCACVPTKRGLRPPPPAQGQITKC